MILRRMIFLDSNGNNNVERTFQFFFDAFRCVAMVMRMERLRIFANGLCVRWVSLWRNSGAEKLMQMTYFFRFCVQLNCSFFFIYFNQNDYGFSNDSGSLCRLGRNGGWKKKEFSQLTFARQT